MNRRVLWTMIGLLWTFLIVFAVIKLFFGEWFVAAVENEKILQIGSFIDSSAAVTFIADVSVSFLAMHFYLCSCKQVWRLPVAVYAVLLSYTVFAVFVFSWNSVVASVLDILALICVPFLLRSSVKQTVSVFFLHEVGQILLLFVRSEPLYFASTNYATQFVILFDTYIWLVLYYLYSNLYKEKTIWENLGSPFSVIRRKRNSKKNS